MRRVESGREVNMAGLEGKSMGWGFAERGGGGGETRV